MRPGRHPRSRSPRAATVTALAADGTDVSFATTPSTTDCDRVFVWQTTARKPLQLGKKQRCKTKTLGITALGVTKGRALWVTGTGSSVALLRLWTATTTKTTPKALGTATRDIQANEPLPIVVGTRRRTVCCRTRWERRSPSSARTARSFSWPAPARVVALAARGGTRRGRHGGIARDRPRRPRQRRQRRPLHERGLGGRDDREGHARAARLDARASPRGRRARVHDDRHRATGRRGLEVRRVVGRQARARDPPARRRARSGRIPARRRRSPGRRSTSRTARRLQAEPFARFARHMYPIVVVLLDGLADRAHDVLKGRTANEAARTPNLDRFAAAGSCGLALRRRPRARALERGRALGDARLPARRVSRARGLRGARPRPGRLARARLRVRGAAAGRAARRRLVADRPSRPEARRRRREGARRRVRRPRGRPAALHARRTSGAARRCCGSRARPTSASPTPTRSSATVTRCSGRSRSCPRRSEPRAPRRSGRAGRWSSSPSTRSRSAARTRACRCSTS